MAIPKKQGGVLRPLVPPRYATVLPGVVKDYLEPILDPLFHDSSFGYRPGRSQHDALAQCQRKLHIDISWVVDLDIKGFDNISHEWMMKMVPNHTYGAGCHLHTEQAGLKRRNNTAAGSAA